MGERTSKMQKILDEVEEANNDGRCADAINALIKAIKLLSRAQQETYDRVDHVANRNPFIGGCE